MDKLPYETLLLIFSKLGLKSKLQCILVCKEWCDIIKTTSLYKSLHLYSSKNSEKTFTLFDKEGSETLGKQLEVLRIAYADVDVDYLLSLPRLFSNLKSLDWIDSEEYTEVFNIETTPKKEIYAPQFAKWAHLETLNCQK